MSAKKMNRKSGLMKKFLVPFAILLILICVSVYFAYTPRYERIFLSDTSTVIRTVADEVSRWTSSFYSEVNAVEAYTKSDISTNDMFIAFSNIVNSRTEIINVYYGNDIPRNNPGGIMVNVLGHLLPESYDQTKRDWYVNALATNGILMTEPYVAASSGELVVTFAKAVYTNNALKGVVGIDVSFSKMSEIMSEYSRVENADINVIMQTGVFITHSNKNNVLNQQNTIFSNPLFSGLGVQDNVIGIRGREWYAIQKIDGVPWAIAGYGPTTNLTRQINRLLVVFLAVIVSLMSFEIVLVFVVVRPLSESLNEAINIIDDMGNGDFNARFEKRMLDKKDQTGYLTRAIDSMQRKVGSAIYKIKRGIDVINNEINKISEGSAHLSDRSNSQAAALEELASSIEALSSSLKETAKSASEARNMSSKAHSDTKSGVEAVIQTANNMKEISESSKKISDITKMIQSIAFQTNILALNAAVEAARAGEQGRGFAVVASEIRSLAQTVNDAASNITNIVEDTVNKIEIGNVSVTQSSELLEEIEKSVNEVSEVLTLISNAVIQEEDSIDQINQAVTELNNITQENSDMANESAISSKEVSDRTENMVEEISYFKFKGDDK